MLVVARWLLTPQGTVFWIFIGVMLVIKMICIGLIVYKAILRLKRMPYTHIHDRGN